MATSGELDRGRSKSWLILVGQSLAGSDVQLEVTQTAKSVTTDVLFVQVGDCHAPRRHFRSSFKGLG